MIQLEFSKKIGTFLVLEKSDLFDYNEYQFVSINLPSHLLGERYCTKASIRHVDENIVELFFCGYKMCYDHEDIKVRVCLEDEYDTKWFLEKISGSDGILIRSYGQCLTMGNPKIECTPCRGGYDIAQSIRILPDARPFDLLMSDDHNLQERKMSFKRFTDRVDNPYIKESNEQCI